MQPSSTQPGGFARVETRQVEAKQIIPPRQRPSRNGEASGAQLPLTPPDGRALPARLSPGIGVSQRPSAWALGST